MIKLNIFFLFMLVYTGFGCAMDENHNNLSKYEGWKLVALEKDRSHIKMSDKYKHLKVLLLHKPTIDIDDDKWPTFITFDFWYPHQIKNGQLKFDEAKPWKFKIKAGTDIDFSKPDLFYIKSVNEMYRKEILFEVRILKSVGALIDENNLFTEFCQTETEASFLGFTSQSRKITDAPEEIIIMEERSYSEKESSSEEESSETSSQSEKLLFSAPKDQLRKKINYPEEKIEEWIISRYVAGGFVAAISAFIILYKMEYIPENMLSWFSNK
jgi:hypothetical protein